MTAERPRRDVARLRSTTWRAVERSIRTVVSVVWTSNPQLLCRLAGFPLPGKPKAKGSARLYKTPPPGHAVRGRLIQPGEL